MNAEINRIDEVEQRALVVYDTSVFGFERQASLSKWPRETGSHARMAVDGELDGWLHLPTNMVTNLDPSLRIL